MLRIAFALLTLTAISVQLSIHIRSGFDVLNFFSYFTNLSNIFAAGVLLLAAAHALSMQERPTSPTHAKKIMTTCVKAVAGLLGNTPTVCRACYIHPVVFEAYEADALDKRLAKDARDGELALLKLLSEREGAAAAAA